MPSLYTACTVSATVAFIHVTLPAPSRMGRTSRSLQIRRDHSSLRLGKSICLLCDWWSLYKLHPSWVTRQIPGEKTTGLEPHPCVVYLLTLSLANYIFLRSSSESAGRGRLHLVLVLLLVSWTTVVIPATFVSPLSLSIPAPAPVRVHAPVPAPCSRPCSCSRS